MFTAVVKLQLPTAMTVDVAKEAFAASAPNYQSAPGLIRKYYLLSEDGLTAGGVYLWDSKASAESAYSDDWKQMIEEKYGSAPSVAYFHSPVIVDNVDGSIQIAD